jgi:hypothetical protein
MLYIPALPANSYLPATTDTSFAGSSENLDRSGDDTPFVNDGLDDESFAFNLFARQAANGADIHFAEAFLAVGDSAAASLSLSPRWTLKPVVVRDSVSFRCFRLTKKSQINKTRTKQAREPIITPRTIPNFVFVEAEGWSSSDVLEVAVVSAEFDPSPVDTVVVVTDPGRVEEPL